MKPSLQPSNVLLVAKPLNLFSRSLSQQKGMLEAGFVLRQTV